MTAVQNCNHIKLYAVVPQPTGDGYGIAEWVSLEGEAPANALHVYVDREKAAAKVKELGAKS